MKTPFLLLTFTLVLDSAYSVRRDRRQSDFWDNWSNWGECSRSCGGGVSFRERQCYSRRADGGSNCIGPTRNYRSCNVQECPEASRDFRAEQCSEYDGMEFQGKRYKWLPYYGASNKCELNCIPKGENFYYRHKMAVLDGTPCDPGRRDICVEGVCKTVGCDNVLDSSKREDHCLVCGGDGSSCYEVKGSYDSNTVSKGYSQLFTIPIGAINIQIREVSPTRNFLAVKNARGDYYLNGHWTIEYSRALPVASTVLHYYRSSEGDLAPEVLTARGPTTEPLLIELIGQEPNRGVHYEYYLPNSLEEDDYRWSYGSWTECSAECGGGYQSRLVFCTIDNEAYPDYMCTKKPAPANNRTCSIQPCPQTKRISYLYQPTMWNRLVNTKMTSWKAGEWGPCTATCGGGTQTRSVYCATYEGRAYQQAATDAECSAFMEKPPSQQVCNLRSCAKWSIGPWTQCSAECGEGIQKRTVTCKTDTGAIVQDTACLHQVKPLDNQICYAETCVEEIGWHIGEWGLCSKSCSNGIRKRQVVCADSNRNIFDPATCEAYEPEKPVQIEHCNMQPCYLQQQVPSMQDTWGYDNSDQFSLARYRQPTLPPPLPAPKEDNFLPSNRRDCRRSRYGCCSDGVTFAQGFNNEGCPSERNTRADLSMPSGECRTSTYGCCFDNVNKASGPLGEGCQSKPSYDYPTMCLLPSALGPCSDWTTRWYFVPDVGKCNRFWYGGCQGNKNNFESEEECINSCKTISGRTTGIIEYRYRQRGMKWDRLSHEHPGIDDATAFGTEQGSRGMVKTLDQDPEGRQWDEHNVGHEESQPLTEQNAYGQIAKEDTSRHSSVYRIILDKAESSSTEASVGETIRLLCRVSDYPFPKVEWQKNGSPVYSTRHTYQSDNSLVISDVGLEDAGTYICMVSNGNRRETHRVRLQVGGVKTSEHHRTHGSGHRLGFHEDMRTDSLPAQTSRERSQSSHNIHSGRRDSKKPILTGPVEAEANLGHRTRLSCYLEISPSTTVEWQKDGMPLPSPRYRKHADGSLVISRVSSEDEGLYTCATTNGSRREFKQIQLKVKGELKITEPPSSVSVAEGDDASLRCVVIGDNVNVKWSRNGVPVQSDGRHTYVSHDGSLVIRNTKTADEGAYTCNAYSGTHSISASAEVRVSKQKAADPNNECIDHPELANCDLIVYAQLCANEYYGSFCCASCSRHRSEHSQRHQG
ncbi:papilin isoform X1 [Bufo bufo]|uniref:papilin isoform X1 n=1 Tax=Bufo bufo TaxID=8384 RepID=UPI001ABE3FA9|nr:papilin isoform X1 [Bufo bufo]XP_040267541.1 papilin isoform X1 [Bufo bufo]XP_040267542.1 papilin isoform X1 [Bufo bufo]